jgi:hypothetical protein
LLNKACTLKQPETAGYKNSASLRAKKNYSAIATQPDNTPATIRTSLLKGMRE